MDWVEVIPKSSPAEVLPHPSVDHDDDANVMLPVTGMCYVSINVSSSYQNCRSSEVWGGFFWTSYRIQSSKVYIIDIGHRRGKKSGFPKKKSMKYQCWSGGEHQPSGILLMMVSCLCQLETTCNHSRSSYLRLWWPSIAMETPHSSMIFPAINPIQINFDRILQWQLQLPAHLSAVWSNEAPVPPPPPGPVAPVVPERWVHGRNGGPPKG